MLGKKDKLAQILKKYFLLFSVLSMFVGLFIYAVLMYNSLKNNCWANLSHLRDQKVKLLEYWFEERADVVKQLSFCSAVKEQDFTQMKILFREQLGAVAGFENLAFADREGRVLLYGEEENPSVCVVDRNYFRMGLNGQNCCSELVDSRFTENPTVIMSSPVISDQGEITGVIFGPLSLAKIMPLISFLRLGKTGEAYLVNPKAAIVLGDSYIGKDEAQVKIAAVETLRGKENGCGEYKNDQGLQVFGAYRELENFEWGLLVEVEKAELLGPFYEKTGTIIFLCFLFCSLIIYPWVRRVAGKIVLPLEQMSKGIAQFAKKCEVETNGRFMEEGILYEETAAVKNSIGEMGQKINRLHTLLQSQTFYEPLTGLANKRYVFLRGREIIELAHRRHTSCSLIYFSIDRFRQVKENLGQGVSEQILKHIADLLGKTTRISDIAGRPGQDEFVLILPETNAEGAWQLAERFRKKVEETPVEVDYDNFSLTVSVGVATFLGHAETSKSNIDLLENLIRKSAQAMLRAREKGGNRVELSSV